MRDPVLQSVPLGFQWPTIDPFLFCVHHDDAYPAGNGRLGPAASLAGRQIGMDFEPRDGWRMYHGSTVPGFPQHPHRGFETVTFVRRGLIDHADSMGAGARYGGGDTQWLTAGGGIQHAEMFPLLDTEGPNHLELFQIWLNLPAADKMVAPHFTMLWAEDQPTVVMDAEGRAEITVVAGELRGVVPPPPPPASYASRPDSDVAIWHIRMTPNAGFELPAARSDETVRVLYFFEGDELHVGARTVPGSTGLVLAAGEPVPLATRLSGAECLLLQARPIGEPIARQGPFVMNTRDEIVQAYRDYQRTEFGGWPWPTPDPTHGPEPRRFARHADGRVEEPEATPV